MFLFLYTKKTIRYFNKKAYFGDKMTVCAQTTGWGGVHVGVC